MADPNQQGPNQASAATVSAGKQFKKDQGDFNDILKESINLVTKLSKSYNDIEARLASMNKSSINTKNINNEIFKARTKAHIADKQAAEAKDVLDKKSIAKIISYSKTQNIIAALDKKLQLAKQSGDIRATDAAQKSLDRSHKILESVANRLSIEEMGAIQNEEANRIASDAVNIAEKQLAKEHELEKSINISGRAIGLFAEKLGLGREVYEEMVETARELQKVGEKLTFFDKVGFLTKAAYSAIAEGITDPLTAIPAIYSAISSGFTKLGSAAASAGADLKGMSEDSGDLVGKLTSGISSMLKNIPMVGGLLSGLVDGFASIFDLVLGVDDKMIKMGRQLNLSVEETRALNKQYAGISANNGDIFTTNKKLMEMQVKMVDQLGVTNLMTSERLSTMIKLQDIADLDDETQKAITESSILTSKSAKDTVTSVLAQVSGLKQATGIQFQHQKILKEVSNLGGYLGLSFTKYPAQLTKSLLTIKAMGMELKDVDALADSFLDFESSISKEFEAQLITGKDINLMKARELFLNNDLAGAAEQITSQVGSASEFLKLNRIAAESMANAFGMSRDQMGDMLKKQELLSKLGAKDTDNAEKQLKLGLARYKTQALLSAAIGEEAYQNLTNASTQEKIAGFMEKIKNSIVDFVQNSGLIEKLEGFMTYLTEPGNIKKIVSSLKGFFADAIEFIGDTAYYMLQALDILSFGQIPNDFINSIQAGAAKMGANIRSVGSEAVTVSNSTAAAAANTGAPMGMMTANRNTQSTVNNYKTSVSIDIMRGTYVVKTIDADSGVLQDTQHGMIGKTTTQ